MVNLRVKKNYWERHIYSSERGILSWAKVLHIANNDEYNVIVLVTNNVLPAFSL